MYSERSSECQRIMELLPGYSVGGGSDRDRALIKAHLSECPSCAEELLALEQTAELVSGLSMDPAPDLWAAIRPNLAPRPAAGIGWWLRVHRLQTALAGTAAAIALGAWLIVAPHPEPNIEAQGYLTGHASMSWNEPFADKAGLGLVEAIPVSVETEGGR